MRSQPQLSNNKYVMTQTLFLTTKARFSLCRTFKRSVAELYWIRLVFTLETLLSRQFLLGCRLRTAPLRLERKQFPQRMRNGAFVLFHSVADKFPKCFVYLSGIGAV